ncbi:AAA family ATPase [Streptomyces acidiscabies]|uniref:Nuclease SbcCD subunit C n=5 Tax=Streptomyces acidiscabies TaxID=42234 RepID=A0AAP6BG93_9ACTN|nr:SMC family ATPase [Streptomyces acidiscabies]MBP5941041.1 SMC family ATPase [Streptomyces sp. LBUM 1476]MBZ3912357.1 SMC family ATPase [Streptomyces acidiscabies]MDX2964133.1 SMC family ATPase [Streptomyces acidiscabies]MDX3021682.1 SMC family ATPase [Streptomyces acidiscabies]MDX3795055.1 SMC family ATPase [Streptomyces acidiscabies]
MRLHRLSLTAFGPFGASQTVDFDALSTAGLFLLHGPTGAGKTSVLDAVCYALYGVVPGDRQSGQGLTLRSDHAAPDVRTEVTLDLTVAGRRLEITRQPPWQRPKKRGAGTTLDKAQTWLREHKAGTWKDLSRSHQEIGEEITQLLGMSREQFCQVVLLPQGDFARFLRADAEARGKLLGRLFDTRRFAEVEQRLADRRRTAEARVKDGDATLLADAHRMQQAAGDTFDLPDLTPGEPGLAEEVLAAAAIARSTAREQLTIAHCGRAAAESAQNAAQRALDDVRELAGLQRRFGEAQARAALLQERSGAYEEARARMDRARKAEAVQPALALREQADAEHARAASDEARARALLPQPDSEADAASLTAAARRTTEELGGLESARRAERRLAELAGDRATLDRQERADAADLTDAEAWLTGWDATREALQTRIDAAQDATTRAEKLAERREPARRRLTAAELRDSLTRDIDTAQQQALTSGEAAQQARAHWLDLKEQRLDGIAAELAASLVDGAPCAVCGATEHPAPARKDAGHVDRAAEEQAFENSQHAAEAHERDEQHLNDTRQALAAASAEAGDTPTATLTAEFEDLERQYAHARHEASDLHPAREELRRAEQEHEHRTAVQRDAAVRVASRAVHRENLEREQADLEQELARARGTAESVAARAAHLERRAHLLTGAADAVRTAEESASRLKDADGRLAEAAYRAGFGTPREAADALLAPDVHRDLQHRLDAWQAEESAVRAVLAEPGTAAAARRPPADVTGAADRASAAAEALQVAASARDAAARRCEELDRLSTRAESGVRALAPLRREYDRVARLAGLTAGTSADNERKMRLEAYVLAARLEQVAAAATVRLQHMSSGRYTLVHSADRSGRGRSGLGLHVVDAWTGRERDTATLSGGETFFASLALALGLADVVTDEAGGVRLDTLFIDEGFGSLDDQTLDEVLDVLDSLRERDRSVGIVSHVADLRRRIHAQLEVVKGRTGSTLRRRGH